MVKTMKTILKYFEEYKFLLEEHDTVEHYILKEEDLHKVINKILDVGEYKEDVDIIYKLYPTKCKTSGRSTGKTIKNKFKIAILLRDAYEVNELSSIIKRYHSECERNSTWMMNFATFLNNVPDYEPEKKPEFYITYLDKIYEPEGFDSETGYPLHSNFIIKKLLTKEWIKINNYN